METIHSEDLPVSAKSPKLHAPQSQSSGNITVFLESLSPISFSCTVYCTHFPPVNVCTGVR
jgi:hypothetical protein